MNFNDSFSVTYHTWGVLVSLPIGVDELCMLSKFYRRIYGYNLLDNAIGQKYNCICLTNKHDSNKWREELGIVI